MKRDVFISYKAYNPNLGNIDANVATEICEALENAGILCWMAPRNIRPGQEYDEEIENSIPNCRVLLLVFSKYTCDSRWIKSEVGMAFEREIDIIPFKLDDSKPRKGFTPYLQTKQWIDASGDYKAKFPELIDTLCHKLGKPIPVQPPKESSNEVRRTTSQDIQEVNLQNSPKDEQISKVPVQSEPEGGSIKQFTVNGVSFNMVHVEGGTFMMGATAEQRGEADGNEKPAHQVSLSSFHIGQTLVTQALWQAVMGSNPSHFKGNLLCPVENVSWNDCQTFIRTLNKLTGENFRLPTEAEWEYAARGGVKNKGYKYAGGNTISDVAWFSNNSSSTPHPVATKSPNELGLYDMGGNVWEWCQDWYSFYSSSPSTNPTGSSSGSFRVLRGGGWSDTAWNCRVSVRYQSTPSSAGNDIGLRLAL